jgi:hypothetical protein
MQQTNPRLAQVDTVSPEQVRGRTRRSSRGVATAGKLRASHFGASLLGLIFALAAVACGGPADRPHTEEVSGTADYIASESGAAHGDCEHGTVVECKVWITDVDCFTGLAVCDHGELSGCMDADAAEAALERMDRAVE